jgi:hypothetical protein
MHEREAGIMSRRMVTWILGALGAVLIAAGDFALHEPRIGEVVFVAGLIILGLFVVVVLAVIVWQERRRERRERRASAYARGR